MQSAKEIGAMLRRIREEKGLTPDQVQAETKIRLRYLEALESGDEGIIPGEVYYKGFLRFYANHLGLDGQALVEQYKEWKDTQRTEQEQAAAEAQAKSGRKPRPVAAAPARVPTRPAEPARRQSTVGPVGSRSRRPRWTVFAAVALAAIVIAGAAWGVMVFRQHNQDAVSPPVTPGTTPGASEPSTPTTPTLPTTPTVEVVKEDLGTAGLRYRATGSTIKVEVEANKLCWVSVRADGALIFENDLAPGAKAVWEAKQRIVVLYGNIGGVKFSVNGIAQDVAGKDGEVRTVTYEPK